LAEPRGEDLAVAFARDAPGQNGESNDATDPRNHGKNVQKLQNAVRIDHQALLIYGRRRITK
jgi:hypothetical protein